MNNQHGWEKAGIVAVGDLCHHSEDRLLSHSEITEKYKIHCTFLEALGLRMSIPLRWRKTITANWQPEPSQVGLEIRISEDHPQDITSLTTKKLYSQIIVKSQHVSAAQNKWRSGEDEIQIQNQQQWADVSARSFTATRETKLQSLHFKVLNRIIPRQTYLKQLRIVETDACTFCGERDSIAHFLKTCRIVESFWRQVCGWFQRADDLYLDKLSTQEFLFGIPKEAHKSAIINFILLNVHFFVHRQKLFHEAQLDLTHWLNEFRTKLQTERWICARLGRKEHFKKWSKILKELG